jgi:hypothetical protein
MTLMIGLHHFFLEMSKKCWPRFRVRDSTSQYCEKFKSYLMNFSLNTRYNSGHGILAVTCHFIDLRYKAAHMYS